MTRKLFYDDPYVKEFTAVIASVRQKDGKYHIVLDRTAFYPEGGGQPCDTGWIGDQAVSYVYEEDEKVYHVVEKWPGASKETACRIDWDRRFDHMQQHLGQHLLSAELYTLYKAGTVGFHLGKEYATIDTDRILSMEEVAGAESSANGIIFRNIAVDILYPSKEEMHALPLRKQPQAEENVRIVKVGEVDYSACCGTHPARTGEVGIVKVLKSEKYKGGNRITFLCGKRAWQDYTWRNNTLQSLAALLSINEKDIVNGFQRMSLELQQAKKELRQLQEQQLDARADELLQHARQTGNVKIVRKVLEDFKLQELRTMASRITETPGTVVLLAGLNHEGVHLLFSRSRDLSQISMNALFKEVMPVMEGRGGGNDAAAQGSAASADKLDEALELAELKIAQIVSN